MVLSDVMYHQENKNEVPNFLESNMSSKETDLAKLIDSTSYPATANHI